MPDKFHALAPKGNNAAPKAKSTENSKIKASKKKPHKKKKEVLHWNYDDECTIGNVLHRKGEFTDPKVLSSQSEVDKYEKELEKAKAKPKKAYKLPVGVKRFSQAYHRSSSGTTLPISTFEQFQKMTQDGAPADDRLPLLKIICVILSSYLMRSMLKVDDVVEAYRLDESELRAMYVSVSEGENAFYILKQICESMIVSTAVDDDDWSKLSVPIIIAPRTEQLILEYAHLKVRGFKEYKWPAPYRDTAVLLDARMLKPKDIKSFASLNPWCSCIIYGKKPGLLGYGEHIKGTNLTAISLDWNTQAVSRLVAAYVAHIPDLFRIHEKDFTRLWLQSGVYLSRYLNAHKTDKLSDARRFKRRVEVTALLSFLSFTQEVCAVDAGSIEQFQKSLLDLLLPDCLPPRENAPASQPLHSPQEIFERELKKMLTTDNLRRFYPLPDRSKLVWPKHTEQGDMIWGYIKWYDWPGEDGKIPCLILLDDSLKYTVSQLDPQLAGFKDVLSSIKKEKPPYLHSNPVVKTRQTAGQKAEQTPAFRLKISELPIDESIKRDLLAMAIK